MKFQEVLLAITAIFGIYFAIPAMAAGNGYGIPDDQQQLDQQLDHQQEEYQ